MKKIAVSGIVLLIAMSPLFRGLFFSLESSIFLAIIALLSVIYLMAKLANKEPMYFNKFIFIFGFLLVAAYALSFIKAVSFRDNITTLMQYAVYFIVSLILYDYYQDKRQAFGSDIITTVIISGFINAIIGIEALTGSLNIFGATFIGKRIGATFQYANTASIFFVVCLLFLLAITNTSEKAFSRVLFAGIGNTIFLAMLLTGSRGGYIVGVVVLLLYFLMQPSGKKLISIGSFVCIALPALFFVTRVSALGNSHDNMLLTEWIVLSFTMAIIMGLFYEGLKRLCSRLNRRLLVGIVIAVPLLVLLIILYYKGFSGILPKNIVDRFARLSINDINVFRRLEFDEWALRLIHDNWVFGLGGGGWTSLYESVQDIYLTARSVHNNYFQVFVESGILGFLSYFAVVIVSLYYWFIAWKKSMDVKQKIIIAGLSCGFISLVVHSSFDFDLTFPSVALLFWALIAGSAVYLPEMIKEKTTIKKLQFSLKSSTAKIILICFCSALVSLYGIYALSAYYADKGMKYMDSGDLSASRAYYEEAYSLDPINAGYTFELTKLYNNFSENSNEPENMKNWEEKARAAAERSIALDPYYPAYTEMLVRTYLNSGMLPEALQNAEKLIKYQPLKTSNYELLARCYLEAADYYIKNQNIDEGKKLLILCSQIDNLPHVEINEAILGYKEQALDSLREY